MEQKLIILLIKSNVSDINILVVDIPLGQGGQPSHGGLVRFSHISKQLY